MSEPLAKILSAVLGLVAGVAASIALFTVIGIPILFRWFWGCNPDHAYQNEGIFCTDTAAALIMVTTVVGFAAVIWFVGRRAQRIMLRRLTR